jgi:peptidoglycan/LPS O-acetylase OafA/YrhL
MASPRKQKNYNNYRSDIDGLRAIAVLSVVLFHINEKLIPGGFVGVDIFFVISGYLITLHILRDLDKGSFSIVEFYRRRVKRIAPAMLVVVLVTIVLAQFILRPGDAEKVAESGLWSLFSMANVYFWLFQDTSYFAAASSEMPLLHLWSLGVEEQFYIVWPLILLATYRIGHGKYFLSILGLLAVASFLLGEFYFSYDPSFVYYMLPTRAGELLVGALLAHFFIKKKEVSISEKAVSITALSGFLLVTGSLFLLSEDEIFPGLRAVPPTVGAAMLIFAGHFGNSFPTRLLKLKPMVWIGLISYSAYLWHWPLLAFYRYGQPEVSLLAGTIILMLTILLAWLSYLYIEMPARHSKRPATQIFFRQFILPSAVLAILSVASMKADGYGMRWFSDDYKSSLIALRDETRPAYLYDYVCQSQLITLADVSDPNCVIGVESNIPAHTILWGDSNAAHYIGAIGAFAKESGFRFRNLQIGFCPPVDADASTFVTARRVADCRNSREITLQAVTKYQVIMISANWSSYQSRSDRFFDVFFETVRSLVSQGKRVIVVGKAPIISTYDRLCREKALSFPLVSCDVHNVLPGPSVVSANARLMKFALQTKHVEYYDFNKYLCPNGSCSAYDENGKLMYYDPSHLSLSASWDIGNTIHKRDGVPFPFSRVAEWASTTK